MFRKSFAVTLIVALCIGLLTPFFPDGARAETAEARILFDDQLGEGIIDHSWAERTLTETGIKRSGSFSIRFNPSMGDALYLYSTQYFLTKQYNTLEFYVHGGSAGGQALNVVFQAGGKQVAAVALNDYLEAGQPLAGDWQKVQIFLPSLKMPNDLFDGVLLVDATKGTQADIYVDEIKLTLRPVTGSEKPPSPIREQIVAYDNEVKDGFLAFGRYEESETAYARSAPHSLRVDPTGDLGLYLYRETPPGAIRTTEYIKLEFWYHGGPTGGQSLDLIFKAGGVDVLTVDLNAYLDASTETDGEWRKVSVPLESLPIPNDLIDGLLFVGKNMQSQPSFYLDDISFVKRTYEQPHLESIGFATEELLMYAGNHETPILTATYDNGYAETVTQNVYWASSAPDVVSVDGNGSITALSKGEAIVTATFEALTASLAIQVIEVVPETIYDDALNMPLYDDWSWAERNLGYSGEFVRSGDRAIEFVPRWWQGVYFNRDESELVQDYYGFEFWVNGGAAPGGQSLRFVVQDMNSILGSVVLDDVLPEGLKPNEWQKVTVRFGDMGIVDGYFNAIVFQAWDPDVQAPAYIDDVKLLRYKDRLESPVPEVTEVTVAIDTNMNRKPVNPDIYGVNYEEIEPEDVSPLDAYPVVRWGGNAVTRYNWELNVQNHASDWFFMNLPKENAPNETLPHGSRSDQFIDDTLANGGKVLLQVPTIGWTPKDRSVNVGFSVEKYGEQQQTECAYGGWWCNPDAGNGIRTDGTPITNNDPQDTSKEIGPEFVQRWIEHIQSRVGDKVNYYALDNEPMLWPYTHRDVHPEMTTSSEIWAYTEAYGKAIKETDPDGQIFGPVVWGWCAYLYSAKDGCAPGEDFRTAQEGKPFLEWYLEKVAAYEADTGIRLIDYLDIHYYPAESGVSISEDESKAVSARRLRSLKSLYDPEFRDSSSWIWEPVNLIPRMKQLIAENAPGTKLAITEYNFGNGRGISSGLAQAEALAIFGREGVDLATRWGQPLENTPVEDAFKLYLDYDGQGGKIEGDSVLANSSDVDLVGAYAIHGDDGKLYILLFNKDTAPKSVRLTVGGASPATGDVYRFDATNRLGFVETIAIGGETTIAAPARSATLIVAKP